MANTALSRVLGALALGALAAPCDSSLLPYAWPGAVLARIAHIFAGPAPEVSLVISPAVLAYRSSRESSFWQRQALQ